QPSGYINTKILFADADTGYIMNTNGDLLKTSNKGVSWSLEKNFSGGYMIEAFDSTLVIAGWNKMIYVSTDKGKTWQTSSINTGIDHLIDKIEMVSKDTFFVVSRSVNLGNTELFQSVDKGRTWQLVNNTFIIQTVDLVTSKLGYATSHGGIYKTTDGGKTWNIIFSKTTTDNFASIKFLDANTGYSIRESGTTYKTTDGGATWTIKSHPFYGDIRTIHFVNALTIYAGSDEGRLYRSVDGGISWQLIPADDIGEAGIYSIFFLDTNTGFFVGHKGRILKTTDGGASWQNYSPTYIDIKPVSFPTSSIGYAASWTNLFKTTDAGLSWTKLNFSLADQNDRFQHLHFFNKDTGIALAHDPVQVYKTYNGGQTWSPLTLPILYKDYITGFYVVNGKVYLDVYGAYGHTMLLSYTRGDTWQIQQQSTESGYRNLFFIDEKTGYGTIGPSLYKTTDSAKTWTLNKVSDNFFNGIWFTDSLTGFAMGDQGFNHRTKDAGKTWEHFEITPGNFNFDDVMAVRFFNKKIGYLLTDKATIYKTFDGGRNWHFDFKTPWVTRIIVMTGDTSVYIAGDHGSILKKDIREYMIDSLEMKADPSCTFRFSAQVTAVLSAVDTVWFEYGTDGFNRQLAATPGNVADSTIKSVAAIQNLSPDSTYKVRVKIYYGGKYYYSDTLAFEPVANLPQPIITANGSLLTSSAASGNQWFLNSIPIAGATATTYQATVSGLYTVQQKLNGCASAMSAPFNFVATAINDPVLAEAISVFPNPVPSTLFILNKQARKLTITLYDGVGKEVKKLQTSSTDISLDLQSLNAGIYILFIREATTYRKLNFIIAKQ
ncbi:MAG TPA: YCF48-related protein, partial [Chitinophagaceae bacterium]|nr:YCF48-related protein [Chitinophagaceae bacterium]